MIISSRDKFGVLQEIALSRDDFPFIDIYFSNLYFLLLLVTITSWFYPTIYWEHWIMSANLLKFELKLFEVWCIIWVKLAALILHLRFSALFHRGFRSISISFNGTSKITVSRFRIPFSKILPTSSSVSWIIS